MVSSNLFVRLSNIIFLSLLLLLLLLQHPNTSENTKKTKRLCTSSLFFFFPPKLLLLSFSLVLQQQTQQKHNKATTRVRIRLRIYSFFKALIYRAYLVIYLFFSPFFFFKIVFVVTHFWFLFLARKILDERKAIWFCSTRWWLAVTMASSKKTKINIKPFRNQVQMDPNYAGNTWKLLKNAIYEIHKQNASGLSFEELYRYDITRVVWRRRTKDCWTSISHLLRNAYNMVLHKQGDTLYNGLKSVVDEHLKGVASRVAMAIDDYFLQELNKSWQDHKISMLMIRDILMYMVRLLPLFISCPNATLIFVCLFVCRTVSMWCTTTFLLSTN